MKFCPYCGEALPVPTAKFCPECGERLAVQAEGPAVPSPEKLWQQAIAEPEDYAEAEPEPELPLPVRHHDAQQQREYARAPVALRDEPAPYPREDNAVEVDFVDFEDPYFETGEPEPEEEPAPRGKAKAPKRVKPAKTAKSRKPRSGSGKIWAIILAAVLVLTGGASFVVLKMNAAKAPQRAVDAFVAAVAAGDTKYLLANMETSGSGLASAADAKQMCTAMSENLNMTELREHLLAGQGDWAGGNDEAYSSFSLKQTKDTLFSQKFVVKISPIEVLVQTHIEDIALYVNDKAAKAEKTDDGLLLKLSPGTHNLRAVYEQYGPEYELGKAEITSFSATEPNTVLLTKALSKAEIELAGTETGLQFLIDGTKSGLKQTGGFLVLDPAFAGMKITVKCDQYSQDFTLAGGDEVLEVNYIKELEGKSANTQNPAEMTNRQLMNLLAPRFYLFYQSYLEAINQWDKKLITGVSDAYRADLITKMEAYNEGLLFNFNVMTFDRRSISRAVKESELYVTFNIQADFNYAEKTSEGKWFAGGNYQIVTMHYNAAAKTWEVFGTVVKDKLEFSDDTFTIKP